MLNCLFGSSDRRKLVTRSENEVVGKFTWRIDNFSSLDGSNKQLYSDTFEINETRWRLMLYPSYVDYLSVFLQVVDSNSLPYGWSTTAKCNIALINQLDNKKNVTEEFEHEFTAKQSEHGCQLSLTNSGSVDYLVNDTCLIEAEVTVIVVNMEAKNELEGRFRWKIKNFTSLDEQKLSSSTFAINGNRWRLILYPKGNNVDCLSASLEVLDSVSLPHGWRKTVKGSISVINQLNSKKTVKREFEQQFTAKESDWSCRSLLSLSKLHKKNGGYLVKGTCLIEVQLSTLQEENRSAAEEKQARDQKFTWKIENFTTLYRHEYHYSSVFVINEQRWWLLICPDYQNHLSVHLGIPDPGSLPDGWSRTFKVSIAVINQFDSNKTVKKEFEGQYTKELHCWGTRWFLPLSELRCKTGGYLVEDTCLIEAHIPIVADKPKPLDDDVKSVYDTAKSFLRSVPKKSCSPISDATLEIPLFEDKGTKECHDNDLISIPLNDLSNPKHETAMIQTLSILSDNLSLFSDEQAKEIIDLKASFPKVIQDLRDSVQVKASNEHLCSTFERSSNLLEDLVETDEGIKTRVEELNGREKELNVLKEERREISQQTKQVYNVAEEQYRKIKGKEKEVNLANKKLEDMKSKWTSIMQSWILLHKGS